MLKCILHGGGLLGNRLEVSFMGRSRTDYSKDFFVNGNKK